MIIKLLRKLYREFLSRFFIFRKIRSLLPNSISKSVDSLIRFGVIRYFKNKLRITKLECALAPLSDEAGDVSYEVKIIFNEEVNKSTKPIFRNLPPYIDSSIYDGTTLSPKVSYHRLKNAHVVGRTEFIIKDKRVYYPKLIEPQLDMFMAEIDGHASINDKFNSISISMIDNSRTFGKAVSLLGQANGNYLHFLTETLSRLAVLDSLDDFSNYSILIEDNLHPKFYEAIELLNTNSRDIIRISPYEMVLVQELLYISPLSYTPPETRKMFTTGKLASVRKNQFVFSQQGLRMLRKKSTEIGKQYVPYRTKAQIGLKNKSVKNLDSPGYIFHDGNLFHSVELQFVFLQRNAINTGNGRLLKNQGFLNFILVNDGFTPIDPAKFSFEEQVLILTNSKIVVSPVGASLGNLIFCDPGVNVVLISPVFPGATFFYFANLLSCLGHHITYVLGKQCEEQGVNYQEFYNRDFTVPLNEVLSAINHYRDLNYDPLKKL